MRRRILGVMALAVAMLVLAGCSVMPVAEQMPEPSQEAEAPELDEKQQITKAYVDAAIARYERDGQEAAFAHFNNLESIEDDRYIVIMRAEDQVILSIPYAGFLGTTHWTGVGTPIGNLISRATEEGNWFRFLTYNLKTGQEEPALYFTVLKDNLIFMSVHTIVLEDLAAATQDYVQRAIDFFDREGREATIQFYDSRESLDGQFYLFLIDENDIYLAHPIFPHLKGTDIKNVVGSDGYELGKEIAKATEAGHWVEYLWPHPVTRVEGPKSAWVIRHGGLIFASGYYDPGTEAEDPAWKGANPQEYTVTYVEQAIARYDRDGLEAMKNYYNSVASFEGQWYLFVMDADDIYIVHPLLPHLIGTDIKVLVDSTGFELGKAFANATAEGNWIEYLWPHPITLQDAPKVGYAKRHDGLIFASGYYPVSDPQETTQDYVARAIAFYDREGLEATVAHYGSKESIEGQWFLTMFDLEYTVLLDPLEPSLIGKPSGIEIDADENGVWSTHTSLGLTSSESDVIHIWAVIHDNLIFVSGYFASE